MMIADKRLKEKCRQTLKKKKRKEKNIYLLPLPRIQYSKIITHFYQEMILYILL